MRKTNPLHGSSSIQENWRKEKHAQKLKAAQRRKKRDEDRERSAFFKRNIAVYVFPFTLISIHSSVAITDNGLCILPCISV